jgi:hypothetical protein
MEIARPELASPSAPEMRMLRAWQQNYAPPPAEDTVMMLIISAVVSVLVGFCGGCCAGCSGGGGFGGGVAGCCGGSVICGLMGLAGFFYFYMYLGSMVRWMHRLSNPHQPTRMQPASYWLERLPSSSSHRPTSRRLSARTLRVARYSIWATLSSSRAPLDRS